MGPDWLVLSKSFYLTYKVHVEMVSELIVFIALSPDWLIMSNRFIWPIRCEEVPMTLIIVTHWQPITYSFIYRSISAIIKVQLICITSLFLQRDALSPISHFLKLNTLSSIAHYNLSKDTYTLFKVLMVKSNIWTWICIPF